MNITKRFNVAMINHSIAMDIFNYKMICRAILSLSGQSNNGAIFNATSVSGGYKGRLLVVVGSLSLKLSYLTVAGFHSSGYGGAILITTTGEVIISNCTFINNVASTRGGTAAVDASSVSMSNCTFENNYVTAGRGGGAYLNITGSMNYRI